MKIGFTADLHIKLGQKNVPVVWAKNRYRLLFEQMKQIELKIDRWIIGGDIFDKVPSPEELEVFVDLVLNFGRPTNIYAGNHESVKKDTTFLTNFKRMVSGLNPLVRVIDDFFTDELGIDYIPYNKLKQYHPGDINFHGKILCTHVRGEIPPHVKAEVPLELFDRWETVLAGDLHSYANCQRNILYPGSPVTTSFHRSSVDTGIIIMDIDTLDHTWEPLNLPQLIRKTIQAGDAMPATDYDHTIYEIEGDMSQLGSVLDSDLIDKKVMKRETDTVLILEPDMTIEQEVDEYLRYVLQLSDSTVGDVLKVLNSYANKL